MAVETSTLTCPRREQDMEAEGMVRGKMLFIYKLLRALFYFIFISYLFRVTFSVS